MSNRQVLLGITILGTALVSACSNDSAGTKASGGAGGSSSNPGTGGDNGTGGTPIRVAQPADARARVVPLPAVV